MTTVVFNFFSKFGIETCILLKKIVLHVFTSTLQHDLCSCIVNTQQPQSYVVVQLHVFDI